MLQSSPKGPFASRGGPSRLPVRGIGPRFAAILGILAAAAGCSSPTSPDSAALLAEGVLLSWAQEAALLIDSHRAKLGCAPLKWHSRGASVAEAYSRQMSDEGFFGHVDPSGTTLKDRLTRAGISGYRLAAETIAAGQNDATRVTAAWLASPTHRQIIEDCQFNHVGLGFHSGSGPYREYWTAVFLSIR